MPQPGNLDLLLRTWTGVWASPMAANPITARARAVLFASIDIIQFIGSANRHNADLGCVSKRSSAIPLLQLPNLNKVREIRQKIASGMNQHKRKQIFRPRPHHAK